MLLFLQKEVIINLPLDVQYLTLQPLHGWKLVYILSEKEL